MSDVSGASATNLDRGIQIATLVNESAMSWYSMVTGRQQPAVRESVAERFTGSRIDQWSLVLIVGFTAIGIWLATSKR